MSRVEVSGSVGVSNSFDPVTHSKPSRRPGALSSLSDRELLSRVRALVSQERAVTLEILVHLIEVERRRLYLGLGYPSLFEYCVRHLGYSSSAAGRRIPAARCIRDYPEVYGLLERNEMNLITVSLVASILTRSNAEDLFKRVRGKTQREVEEIVAEYRPPLSMRDRAKPVCVKVTTPVAGAPVTSGQVCPRTPTGGSEISPSVAAGGASGPPRPGTETQPLTGAGESVRKGQHDPSESPTAGEGGSSSSGSDTPPAPKPCLERKFLVQFLASERFMTKFERAKALLSNKSGSLSYEAVIETALDEFLKDHDPENRKQRRDERKERANSRLAEGKCVESRESGESSARTLKHGNTKIVQQQNAAGESQLPDDPEPSRHIPAAVRDAVFVRDLGRCTYAGPDGKRCGSTHNLQFDHIVPFARGGTTSIQNLRLLCGKHNRLAAERFFGRPAVRGRVKSRERRRLD